MSNSNLTVECEFQIQKPGGGAKKRRVGPEANPVENPGRIPRISRLMALAIRLDGLIRSGVLKDYAVVARLGHVSRARVTQVMNLLHLAPDIQEELLFLPLIKKGKETLRLKAFPSARISVQDLWKAASAAAWSSSAQPATSAKATGERIEDGDCAAAGRRWAVREWP